MTTDAAKNPRKFGLMLAVLGVVYGDIGTSPLYALRECFFGDHSVPVAAKNVIGVCSLIFWSLILIVSLKYLVFVLRASNKGEGGILALLALALPAARGRDRMRSVLLVLGVFGAALLFGDGMITPAISVLSAVEGLRVATPAFQHYVIPLTMLILVALFSVQRFGTGRVGKMFGPIMVIWFVTLAGLGIRAIVREPQILQSFAPWHGAMFLMREGKMGLTVLGAVFLVVTGGEALYADMGHFGVQPIRRAWFGLVLPALMLNYLGQGALLISKPSTAENPFYLLAPEWMLGPLVALATAATVIASQALISGVYSITMHALQLGYLPRMKIRHTSATARGQIYMPHVNWLLMLACLGLVAGFQSSSHLAAAYGVAVTLTMMLTSILFYFASQRVLGWSVTTAAIVCSFFFVVETAFFIANSLKIAHGGWFPLAVACILFTIMSTWRAGRAFLKYRLEKTVVPWDEFFDSLMKDPPTRVKGTAVFMSGNPSGTPVALLHNLKHNKVLHERVVLLTILIEEEARVEPEDRVKVQELNKDFYRVTGRYGFMEEPHVPDVLRQCKDNDLDIELLDTTFFMSRETIIPSDRLGLPKWRAWLFALISRNAQPATDFYGLPPNRVVELGMQLRM